MRALKPARRLHGEIQRELKEYIIRHSLRAGDPLPSEGDLAQQLEASRNSVREAVRALEGLGIIEARAGSGLFVTDFSFDPILTNLPYAILSDLKPLEDLLEVRLHLEKGMADRILECVTPEQIRGLEEILDLMESEAGLGRYSPEADREFHARLYGNLDNQIMTRILDVFWDAFYQVRERASLVDPLDPVETYRAHVAILEAFEAGDVQEYKAAIEQHYDGIYERLDRSKADERRGGA